MSDTTKPLPPLVEVLENADRFGLSGIYEFRIGLELHGDYLDRDKVLEIAAPYDAEITRLREQNDQLGNQLAAAASSAIALRELLREAREAIVESDSLFAKRDIEDLLRRIQEVAQ